MVETSRCAPASRLQVVFSSGAVLSDAGGAFLSTYNPWGIDPIYDGAALDRYVKLYESDFDKVIKDIFHVNGDIAP